MLIKRIKIFNSKRHSLNNLISIEYTPKKRTQIILGTNGSGKSSLLWEISCLPADFNDYFKGGYKEVDLEHEGVKYTLTSGLRKGKHSFIAGGKELNQGGTKKIQLVLCERIFSYTPEIHEIIIGKTNFTNMSIASRKRWLTLMGSIDYEYALKIYTQASEALRNTNTLLKTAEDRKTILLTEKNDTESIASLVKERARVNLFLENILSLRNTDLSYETDTETADAIYKKTENILSLLKDYADIDLETLPELKFKYQISKNELSEMVKDFENMTLTTTTVPSNDTSLENNINTLKKSIATIQDSFPEGLTIANVEAVCKDFEMFFSKGKVLLEDLDAHSDFLYSPERVLLLSDKALALSSELSLLRTDLESINYEITAIRKLAGSPKVTCKKCNNSWVEGFDEQHLKKQLIVSESKQVLFDYKTLELSTLNEEKARLLEIIETVNLLEEVKRSFPVLSCFWETLGLNNIGSSFKPNEVLNNIFKLKEQIIYWEPITKKVNELKLLQDKYTMFKNFDQETFKLLLEKKNKLEKTIESKTQLNHEIFNRIKRLEEKETLVKKLQVLKSEMKTFLKTSKENFLKTIEIKKNETLGKLLKLTRLELYNIDEKIQSEKILDSKLADVNIEITQLEIKRDAFLNIKKHLSPTEGLIAKSIIAFLGPFLDDINKIINKFWAYDMYVLLPEFSDEVDLNYKFPLMVKDNEPQKDISKTSTSMQAIINLAFKLVSMSRLGIETYPLYLDEFGTGMDYKHRENAFSILTLLKDIEFEQIFVVTHFEDFYSKLSDVDVVVLSEDNVFLKDIKTYNEVIEIK